MVYKMSLLQLMDIFILLLTNKAVLWQNVTLLFVLHHQLRQIYRTPLVQLLKVLFLTHSQHYQQHVVLTNYNMLRQSHQLLLQFYLTHLLDSFQSIQKVQTMLVLIK